MGEYEHTTIVNSNPQQVFDFVSDVNNLARHLLYGEERYAPIEATVYESKARLPDIRMIPDGFISRL